MPASFHQEIEIDLIAPLLQPGYLAMDHRHMACSRLMVLAWSQSVSHQVQTRVVWCSWTGIIDYFQSSPISQVYLE